MFKALGKLGKLPSLVNPVGAAPNGGMLQQVLHCRHVKVLG